MKYFDFKSVAREAKIPEQKLRKLIDLIRKEFPNDPMMAELRALRACQAIRDGHVQIDEAIRQQAEGRA
jgi:mRNA-degrading endonuclease YafQ of YafQ-DinJ toxin-antitoxin module